MKHKFIAVKLITAGVYIGIIDITDDMIYTQLCSGAQRQRAQWTRIRCDKKDNYYFYKNRQREYLNEYYTCQY